MQFVRTVFALGVALGLGLLTQSATAAGWGTIKGKIIYQPGLPIPVNPLVTTVPPKDKAVCCAKGGPHTDEWVVNPNNRGVRYVLVWLAPSATNTSNEPKKLPINPKLRKVPKKPVILDQPLCEYVPHMLAIRQGQSVLAKNSASIPHNVKWEGFKNPGNNVLLPSGGEHFIKNLKAERTPIVVECNIHPWMKAHIGVFNHPYFAITDANGNFEIKDAPAGIWRLVAWHDSGWVTPGHRRAGMAVTVKPGETTVVNIAFKPEK
jgi:hypothetical protein